MNNPLEQFQLYIFRNININIFDFSITNFTIYLVIIGILIHFVLYMYFNYFFFIIPNFWKSFLENLYSFVLTLFFQQINRTKSLKYFPLFFSIFVFILLGNFLGLVPFSFSITAQLCKTFTFGFSLFLGIIIIGFLNFKLKFLQIFIPPNVPKLLFPFLIVIEIISYFIRPFSLSIRLFANMLAGHALMYIISNFLFFLFSNYVFLVFIPLFFFFAIIFLEFGIAFIQAYVFLTLICIYLNDTFNIKH